MMTGPLAVILDYENKNHTLQNIEESGKTIWGLCGLAILRLDYPP